MSEPSPGGEHVASWASTPARRSVMLGNRSRDTKPELAIRRRVHAAGLRYRVATRPIKDMRRTGDLVFGPARVVVFVDGCFWHSCPDHGTQPRTNEDYWRPKLMRNVERDRETERVLVEAGWLVIRVWEHEDADQAARLICQAVRARRMAREG